MTTSNASKQATDFNATFEAAADRVRALNEQMIAAAKKNGTASIDAYEKSLKTLVEFQQKAASSQQARLGEHRRPGSDRLHHRGQQRVHRCSA